MGCTGEAKGTALPTIVLLFNDITHRLLFKVALPGAGNLADIAKDQPARQYCVYTQLSRQLLSIFLQQCLNPLAVVGHQSPITTSTTPEVFALIRGRRYKICQTRRFYVA